MTIEFKKLGLQFDETKLDDEEYQLDCLKSLLKKVSNNQKWEFYQTEYGEAGFCLAMTVDWLRRRFVNEKRYHKLKKEKEEAIKGLQSVQKLTENPQGLATPTVKAEEGLDHLKVSMKDGKELPQMKGIDRMLARNWQKDLTMPKPGNMKTLPTKCTSLSEFFLDVVKGCDGVRQELKEVPFGFQIILCGYYNKSHALAIFPKYEHTGFLVKSKERKLVQLTFLDPNLGQYTYQADDAEKLMELIAGLFALQYREFYICRIRLFWLS